MTSHKPLPTIIVTALILAVVLLPGSALPETPGIPGFDKMVHFLMFLTLAIAIHIDFGLTDGRRLGIAIVAALVFSALTEALQLLVEGRSAELFDLVADMSGFIAGLATRSSLASLAVRTGRAVERLFGRGKRY